MLNKFFRKKDIATALSESEGLNGGLKRTLQPRTS
jgi:hypothetical protein